MRGWDDLMLGSMRTSTVTPSQQFDRPLSRALDWTSESESHLKRELTDKRIGADPHDNSLANREHHHPIPQRQIVSIGNRGGEVNMFGKAFSIASASRAGLGFIGRPTIRPRPVCGNNRMQRCGTGMRLKEEIV